MSNRARSFPRAAAFVALWCLLLSAPAVAKPTAEQKCQAGKNRAAGAYARCLQSAEATLVTSSSPMKQTKYTTAVTKCETNFANKWQSLINAATKAGATCLDAPLTNAQFKKVIDDHSDNMTSALNGDGLDDCVAALPQCQSDLAACLASTLPAARVPKTGQTSCYDPTGTGTGISCTGTGQDGDLQKGLVRSYTDNGDGTITDNLTGLIWEKKSDDGSIHDKDTQYTWSDAFGVFLNGPAGLNTVSFAGHNDWRLPNRFELESLVDLGQSNPSIDSIFNVNCGANSSGNPGCLVANCSCTSVDTYYWSSTAIVLIPNFAWNVGFNIGGVNSGSIQFDVYAVRAVRGGL